MKSLGAFFRLLRPLNLLIIILTVCAMRWLVIEPLLQRHLVGIGFGADSLHFTLAVLVMVLLAAAGNIINDYFDVKVDRINRPGQVLIGNQVKRRVAMVAHHAFNALATLIALYLAWHFRQWELAAIPIMMGILLWFYSVSFKKQFIIGNLVVAMMVAIVPLWIGLIEIPAIQREMIASGELTGNFPLPTFKAMWFILIGYAAFAFVITFIREIQKDMEDLAGDREQGFRTMPIVLGIKKTKAFTAGLIILVLIVALNIDYFLFGHLRDWEEQIFYHGPFAVLVALPLVLGFFATTRAKDKKGFKRASRLSKITMVGGIAFAVFLRFAFLTFVIP